MGLGGVEVEEALVNGRAEMEVEEVNIYALFVEYTPVFPKYCEGEGNYTFFAIIPK